MLNPKRIPEVLKALEAYWERHPDLRLGQVVCNMAHPNDLYFVEDSKIKYNLEREFQ